MKEKLNLVIGIIAVVQVIYYLVQCPSLDCRERIIGFPVPGFVYLIFWAIVAIILLFGVYKQNTSKG